MDGHCSTGQSPQWAVVPMEEKEEEEEELKPSSGCVRKIKDKTLTPINLKRKKYSLFEIFT